MKRNITLGTLNISPQGKKYVMEALDNNRLSYGKFTKKFEQDFANLHGCKHGIFLNSGTSALQVALAALKEIHEYKNGDEVIVPATTFIATSNIVLQNGMKPVFIDVRPDTFNIDPTRIYDALTSRTRVIIPVHLFGLPADMPRILTIARRYDLQVLEDSCETVSASVNGQSVGSFGDAACFSNYVAHHVVGGIGGLITTNDDKIAELSRSFMAHGRDSSYLSIDDDDNLAESGLQNIVERRYKFDRLGFSYRATELEAAIALSELERLEVNIFIRRRNASRLAGLLLNLRDKLQLPSIPDGLTHSFMMFAFLIIDKNVNRDEFLLFLEQRGVETRLLMPLLSQPIYQKIFPGKYENYPVAKNLAERGAFIGIHQDLVLDDIDYISNTFYEYFRGLR